MMQRAVTAVIANKPAVMRKVEVLVVRLRERFDGGWVIEDDSSPLFYFEWAMRKRNKDV